MVLPEERSEAQVSRRRPGHHHGRLRGRPALRHRGGKDGPAHGQRHYIRVMAAAEGPGNVISQRTVEAHSETNTYSTCPCRAVSSALHRNELSLSSYHHDVVTTISTSQ